MSSNYPQWPLDVPHKPPVVHCHQQQHALNRPPISQQGLLWASTEQNHYTLETLERDANVRLFYKLDPKLLIRSIAIYWVPSPLKLFDEIKGNVSWLEGISAIISQVHDFTKRVCVQHWHAERQEQGVSGGSPSPRKEANAQKHDSSEPPGLISRSTKLGLLQHYWQGSWHALGMENE